MDRANERLHAATAGRYPHCPCLPKNVPLTAGDDSGNERFVAVLANTLGRVHWPCAIRTDS